MAEPRAVFSLIGPEVPTNEVVVGSEPLTIGRRPDNALAFPGVQQVSSRHAQISFINGVLAIEDLKSTNGTHVNEARLEPNQPVSLTLGDVIRIGPFTLTLLRIDQTDEPFQPTIAKKDDEVPSTPPVEIPTPAPDVHRTEPPGSPSDAKTVQPQRTTPPAKEPEVQPTPVVTPAPPPPVPVAGNGHAAQVDALVLPIRSLPSTNGHKQLEPYVPPAGIPANESRYMQYLPGVFSDSDFLKRYLLIMESILAPLGWGVDSFEQYYNPLVTTPDWLQWIGSWFDILIHPTVPVERQRAVVKELGELFLMRGTRRCLIRLMELYFGSKPEIVELDNPPSTFKVLLTLGKDDTPLNRALASQLINVCKPAYTAFTLEVS